MNIEKSCYRLARNLEKYTCISDGNDDVGNSFNILTKDYKTSEQDRF